MEVFRMSHSEKTQELVDKARELRAQGMSYGKIGRVLDISQQYAMVLLNPDRYNDEKHKKQRSDYGKANRERISANHKAWREKNPEYYANYYKENRERINAYYRNKRKAQKEGK